MEVDVREERFHASEAVLAYELRERNVRMRDELPFVLEEGAAELSPTPLDSLAKRNSIDEQAEYPVAVSRRGSSMGNEPSDYVVRSGQHREDAKMGGQEQAL